MHAHTVFTGQFTVLLCLKCNTEMFHEFALEFESCDRCFFVLGDGGSVRESVCPSGLHLVCAGTTDLSHSADTTVKWMSSKRPGIV